MKKKHVVLLMLVLVAVVALWYAKQRFGVPVITEIERELDPPVFYDSVEDTTLETTYAENITFANASVRRHPEREGMLAINLDVANNGDKTVTKIWAYADFYNSDGRVAAHCNAPLGTNNVFADAPIPPNSSKRAIIVLHDLGNWTGGKMVVTIRQFETE